MVTIRIGNEYIAKDGVSLTPVRAYARDYLSPVIAEELCRVLRGFGLSPIVE